MMKIKKSLAALTATVSIMALATGCSSSGSSGVVDTQADKGLAVMGLAVMGDTSPTTPTTWSTTASPSNWATGPGAAKALTR